MARKRLTRNAYKRKLILFGLLLFLAIGLISTGFAAWMMSANAESESDGNVNVGLITTANLEFESLELYKVEEYYDSETSTYSTREVLVTDLEHELEGFYFAFEPHLSDTTGRVHYGENEIGPESMTMIVRGTLGPIEVLSNLTISLTLPAGVAKAVEAGYIVVPNCANRSVVLTYGNGLELKEGSTSVVEFEYKVEFTWGSAFNFMNPGIYFDEDPSGVTATPEDIQKDLLYLRAYVYGYSNQLTYLYSQLKNNEISNDEFNTQVNALQNNAVYTAPKFTLTLIGNIK